MRRSNDRKENRKKRIEDKKHIWAECRKIKKDIKKSSAKSLWGLASPNETYGKAQESHDKNKGHNRKMNFNTLMDIKHEKVEKKVVIHIHIHKHKYKYKYI